MHYALVHFPQLGEELSAAIDAFRRIYDPSWRLIKPHITICFPESDPLEEGLLSEHFAQVTANWSPFAITLDGFHMSDDHWLFLILREGAEELTRLHRTMYTGYLEKYSKQPGERGYDFIPHLGLGHFIKPGCRYDWRSPRSADFDDARYARCLPQAQALPLPARVSVDRVHLISIPTVVTEWTTGQRETLPKDAEAATCREFPLGRSQ